MHLKPKGAHVNKRIIVAIAFAALAAITAIPSSLAGPTRAGGAATVAVGKSSLGRILVNGQGRTLYMFALDRHGRSACNGACASAWPPLIASGKARAVSGARASLVGRTRRQDGRWQVTYNGHPLYTFYQDTKKGQTNGQGVNFFGGVWNAISPAGAKIRSAGAGSMGYSSGGYGGY
jgi:predicted lipoprotein with Yx(FWY)xxD motif